MFVCVRACSVCLSTDSRFWLAFPFEEKATKYQNHHLPIAMGLDIRWAATVVFCFLSLWNAVFTMIFQRWTDKMTAATVVCIFVRALLTLSFMANLDVTLFPNDTHASECELPCFAFVKCFCNVYFWCGSIWAPLVFIFTLSMAKNHIKMLNCFAHPAFHLNIMCVCVCVFIFLLSGHAYTIHTCRKLCMNWQSTTLQTKWVYISQFCYLSYCSEKQT